MEGQVLDLVNSARRANGCQALVVDPALQRDARNWAVTMVQTGRFEHQSGNFGENIAMGNAGSAQDVFQGWMNSSGHRANILNCGYSSTGIGYDPGTIIPGYQAGSWVQVFR